MFLPSRGRGAVLVWFGWSCTGAAFAIPVFFHPQYPLLSVLSFLSGFCISAVITWLQRGKRLVPTHPLAIACFATIYPAFVVGSSMFASGLVHPGYLDRLVEPNRSLAMAQLLVFVGFGAAAFGASLVRFAPRIYFQTNWFDVRNEEAPLVAIVVYGLGMAASVVGLLRGDYGYPAAFVSGTGTLVLTTITLETTGTIMIWRCWAQNPTRRNLHLVVLLVALIPVQTVLAASRATPLWAVTAAAFGVAQVWPIYSRKAAVFTGFAVVVALAAGMLFGTSLRAARADEELTQPSVGMTFDPPGPGLLRAQAKSRGLGRTNVSRPEANVKTGQVLAEAARAETIQGAVEVAGAQTTSQEVVQVTRPRTSGTSVARPPQTPPTTALDPSRVVNRQARASGAALRAIAERGVIDNTGFLWRRLADRLDHVASVAVIVGQYRGLRNEEKAYGLDHSLLKTLLSAPVPRALWKGKPIVSDGRAMGLVYFGNGSNSYASTPMVELLRNGGWVVVVLGMAILGFLLALGHRTFDSKTGAVTQALFGTIVLRVVNWEAGYGTIFAEALRVIFVTVVAVLFVRSSGRVFCWLRSKLRRSADVSR